jgi:hypothetical protein
MSALAVLAGTPARVSSAESIANALNPLGLLDLESFRDDDVLMCVGQHANAPCHSVAFAESDGIRTLVAGDVINHEAVDWDAIRRSLVAHEASPGCLLELRGSFAIVIADTERHRLWAITDPFAWQPVMIRATGNGVIVSTSLAAILRGAPGTGSVNEDWLFDNLYFNHGVGNTTPVAGVQRLSAATITEVHLRTWRVRQRPYRSKPVRAERLKSGAEAVEDALETFNTVVPQYYPGSRSVTLGLSEGLDCRTVLATTPTTVLERLHSFTFGRPESTEINESSDIARHFGFIHTPVHLDETFLAQLPDLARNTVFLSDGMQNINRSHLLYTYRKLDHDGEPFSVIMTGVSGDHIFRDHIRGMGNVPHILSADAAALHRNGRIGVDATFDAAILGSRQAAFKDRIERSLDFLEHAYGAFRSPETYLSYLMFEAGPRYFGGQSAIANMFSTFRTPYWDPAIVALGYRLRDATLGASCSARDAYREIFIQAAIVAGSDTVSTLPYKNLPIGIYASGNKLNYQAHRLLRTLRSILRHKAFVFSEDWRNWYRTAMKSEIHRLLGDDSRVRSFVSPKLIDKARTEVDVHWLGKLLTIEHTLRFIAALSLEGRNCS